MSFRVWRNVTIPERIKLARFRKAPELGPRVLFFSGGTALNSASRILTEYTHNSIHLVTPFDSGGSSRVLREAFNMLSVGDMRSRLMALADRSVIGHPEIYRLFAHRMPKEDDARTLRERLRSMVDGEDELVAAVPDPMRKIIRNHLRFFFSSMPDDFDLRGASIGNLILVGGFLNNERHIDPVVFMFSKLVEARGTVRTITSRNLHLAAKLENGEIVRGQRDLTGKEVPPITSKVKDIWLTDNLKEPVRVELEIREKVRELIAKAELICFPVGSFYSSIVANLLPTGVAEAIAANGCPKVYIPNCGIDPEQYEMSVEECVKTLVETLEKRTDKMTSTSDLLNFVLVDSRHGEYTGGHSLEGIRSLGHEIIDTNLVSHKSAPFLDSRRIVEAVLSLI